MTCDELRSLLEAPGENDRLAPRRLARHMAACPACRTRFTEVAWLAETGQGAEAPARRPVPVAAAALLLVLGLLGARAVLFPASPPSDARGGEQRAELATAEEERSEARSRDRLPNWITRGVFEVRTEGRPVRASPRPLTGGLSRRTAHRSALAEGNVRHVLTVRTGVSPSR